MVLVSADPVAEPKVPICPDICEVGTTTVAQKDQVEIAHEMCQFGWSPGDVAPRDWVTPVRRAFVRVAALIKQKH